jgi:hydrogenase maturation protease
MPAARWLVLGLGNALAGADGFGPAVVQRLQEAADLPAGVDVADVHTDLLSALDRFPSYDRVVLVDAVLDARGGVAVVDEETFCRWDDRSPGVHHLSPVMAVNLFRRLQTSGSDPVSCTNVLDRGQGSPAQQPDAVPTPGPRIMLVAWFVAEPDFGRPPRDEEIEAGVRAVRMLVG